MGSDVSMQGYSGRMELFLFVLRQAQHERLLSNVMSRPVHPELVEG